MNTWTYLKDAWSAINAHRDALLAPRLAQEETLERITHLASQTSRGLDLGLRSHMSSSEFRNNVPLSTYSDYMSYVHRIKQGEKKVMTVSPVRALVRSTGSTGVAKEIPVTDLRKKQYFNISALWASHFLLFNGRVASGDTLYFSAAEVEDVWDPNGIKLPMGSISGLYYAWSKKESPFFSRKKLILDSDVLNIPKAEERNFAIAQATLTRNVSHGGSSTYATWYNFFNQLIEDKKKHVVNLKSSGYHEQAKKLESSNFRMVDIWTKFHQMSVINYGINLKQKDDVEKNIIGRPFQTYDSGVLSSEAHLNLNIFDDGVGSYLGAFLLNENFYEFIPDKHIQEENPDTLLVDELTIGETYEVVVTTIDGLTRYRTGDRFEVRGLTDYAVPKVAFRGRASTLEAGQAHLYDSNIIKAAEDAISVTGQDLSSYIAFASVHPDGKTSVDLVVETVDDVPISNLSSFANAFDIALIKDAFTYEETRGSFNKNLAPTVYQAPAGSIAKFRKQFGKQGNNGQEKPTPYTLRTDIVKNNEIDVYRF